MIRIGINGFGRIGRLSLRAALAQSKDVEVVGINDIGPQKRRAHLLQYDSVHGALNVDMRADDQFLYVGHHKIHSFAHKDPAQLPWKDLGVDVVLECTGVFRERTKAALHLQAGARKVIISAPGKGEPPDATLVMGVNQETYQKDKHHVVSNASCTTNCLAPVIKVLHENFSVQQAMMTTVHSYTSDQSLIDNDHSDLRRARSAAMSIVPTSTGASEAIAQVYPILQGRVDGTSMRVPTPDVSLIDLSAIVEKDVTEQDLARAYEHAASHALAGILAVSHAPLVSVDYVHHPASAIVDLPLLQVLNKRFVKVIAWYDNEWGFSMRMIDLAKHLMA